MSDPATWFYVITTVLSLVMSEMEKQRTEKKINRLKKKKDVGQQIKSNTRGTSESIKVIYGTQRVGGNDVYITTEGYHNHDLYFAHTLGEGEIEGIQTETIEEVEQPIIWFDGERIHEKYADHYDYEEFFGTSDQICSSLINAIDESFTDPMHYTAYVAWYLKYNEDLFRGKPVIHYLVKGRKLYDFRTSTTAWSDNPVLALYDFFTNSRYGIGTIFSGDDDVWSTVTEITNLFRGVLNYWNGKYYLNFQDLNEESSQMTITDDHIFQGSDGKAMITLNDPGYYDVPKGVRVIYLNATDNLYVQDSFIIGDEDDLVVEFNLADSCTDREMAAKLGVSFLERSQVTRSISGRFRDDCLQLEPNDIITFNSTSMAIADQVMRVISATYTNLGFIDLVLQYEDAAIYDDDYNINVESIYETTLPDPSVASFIENATVTEDTYIQRLRTFSKLEVSFDIPTDSWFDHVEVWVSRNGDVTANYKHQFNAKDDFTMDPVQEGDTYWIVLKTVNVWGVKQAFNNAVKLTHKVIGKSNTPPPSLPYLRAIAGDGSVSLRSVRLDDPDIENYEFRMGDTWYQ